MYWNSGVKIRELVEVCIGVFIFENQTKQNLAMAHQSTLGFTCLLDFNKETLLDQISTVINFINYIDYERPDGFSHNKNEHKQIADL